MYGTLVRFQPKPGQEQAVAQLAERWIQQRGPKVDGFIAEYALTPDDRPGEQLVLTLFESQETYRQNAADPEQDSWYQELRSHLAAEPEWTDGKIVSLKPETVPL